MARGCFKTSDKICVYCGKQYIGEDGKLKPMPFKVGKGANQYFLCQKYGEKDPAAKKIYIFKQYYIITRL